MDAMKDSVLMRDEAALRERLLARALALGIEPVDGRPESAIDALLEREVRVPEAGEDECRRHYEQHAARFTSGELVFASHILFAVTAGAPLDLIRRKAELTLAELQLDPARFAALAAECSNCPSGAQGGRLGQLGRGECVPEFERALFDGAPLGILPRLVASRHGFHIVCIERREPGRQLPFEAVRVQVAARLQRKSLERALAQYLQVLGGSPLVQ
jgi:peptidyl-prolyl cis-trans isomerase C